MEMEKVHIQSEEKRLQMDYKRKEMDVKRVDMEKQRRKIDQKRIEMDQQRVEMDQKTVEMDQNRNKNVNVNINRILDDLEDQNLIKKGEPVSFTLTNEELLVNGVKQSTAVQAKIRDKYNIGKGGSYQYKNDGKGSVSTTYRTD